MELYVSENGRSKDLSLLKERFNRAALAAAATVAALFICAAAVEWVRSAYAPFHGFASYGWFPRLQTFLYLSAMFNILLIRYVVMRIYIAPGVADMETILRRLFNADVASMLLSVLPGLYGLILFLLSGDVTDFYMLFGLSVIYCMIYLPRYKKWISIIKENLTD